MDGPGPPPAATAVASRDLLAGLVAWVAVVTVGTWTARTSVPLANDDVAYALDACALARLDGLAWGPGYAAVYCGLRHVFTDPLIAFWAKQAAVPLLAGLLVHRLGLAFRLGPALAPLSALWCVLALLTVSGTVEFAFVLGLAACLAAASGGRWRWVWFFALMGLALLVRVEYVVGVAGAVALLLGRHEEGTRPGVTAGAFVLAGFLVLLVAADQGAAGRSWFAFGQQFAVNYAEARGLDVDPFVEWQRVAGQAFPSSRSIADALRENPRMAAWHLGYNALVRMPRAVAGALVPVPSFVPWLRGRAVLAALVVALVLLAALAGGRRDWLRGSQMLSPIAFAAIPAVSLIFRPQPRHLLPLLPLSIVIVGTRLRGRTDERHPRLTAGLRLAFAGVLLAGLAGVWAAWLRPATGEASVDGWIRELRRESQAGRVRLLASWYGDRACGLVGPGCRAIPLGDFIEGAEVDAALIGPDWAARPDVRGDARVRGFCSQPERFGCRARAVTPDGFRLVRCRPPLRLPPRASPPPGDGPSG